MSQERDSISQFNINIKETIQRERQDTIEGRKSGDYSVEWLHSLEAPPHLHGYQKCASNSEKNSTIASDMMQEFR